MLIEGLVRRVEGNLRGFKRRPWFYISRGQTYYRVGRYMRWRFEPLNVMYARHGMALLLHHDDHKGSFMY